MPAVVEKPIVQSRSSKLAKDEAGSVTDDDGCSSGSDDQEFIVKNVRNGNSKAASTPDSSVDENKSTRQRGNDAQESGDSPESSFIQEGGEPWLRTSGDSGCESDSCRPSLLLTDGIGEEVALPTCEVVGVIHKSSVQGGSPSPLTDAMHLLDVSPGSLDHESSDQEPLTAPESLDHEINGTTKPPATAPRARNPQTNGETKKPPPPPKPMRVPLSELLDSMPESSADGDVIEMGAPVENGGGNAKYEKDAKAVMSVRQKIAMFTNIVETETEAVQKPPALPAPKPRRNLFHVEDDGLDEKLVTSSFNGKEIDPGQNELFGDSDPDADIIKNELDRICDKIQRETSQARQDSEESEMSDDTYDSELEDETETKVEDLIREEKPVLKLEDAERKIDEIVELAEAIGKLEEAISEKVEDVPVAPKVSVIPEVRDSSPRKEFQEIIKKYDSMQDYSKKEESPGVKITNSKFLEVQNERNLKPQPITHPSIMALSPTSSSGQPERPDSELSSLSSSSSLSRSSEDLLGREADYSEEEADWRLINGQRRRASLQNRNLSSRSNAVAPNPLSSPETTPKFHSHARSASLGGVQQQNDEPLTNGKSNSSHTPRVSSASPSKTSMSPTSQLAVNRSLYSLLESRKQNVSKLKGLVIPEISEKPVAQPPNLPTILSVDSILQAKTSRDASPQSTKAFPSFHSSASINNSSSYKTPNKPTSPKFYHARSSSTDLADISDSFARDENDSSSSMWQQFSTHSTNVSKYSPAFKRKVLAVYGTTSSNGILPSKLKENGDVWSSSKFSKSHGKNEVPNLQVFSAEVPYGGRTSSVIKPVPLRSAGSTPSLSILDQAIPKLKNEFSFTNGGEAEHKPLQRTWSGGLDQPINGPPPLPPRGSVTKPKEVPPVFTGRQTKNRSPNSSPPPLPSNPPPSSPPLTSQSIMSSSYSSEQSVDTEDQESGISSIGSTHNTPPTSPKDQSRSQSASKNHRLLSSEQPARYQQVTKSPGMDRRADTTGLKSPLIYRDTDPKSTYQRFLKANSIEAINRMNVLQSARKSSGLPATALDQTDGSYVSPVQPMKFEKYSRSEVESKESELEDMKLSGSLSPEMKSRSRANSSEAKQQPFSGNTISAYLGISEPRNTSPTKSVSDERWTELEKKYGSDKKRFNYETRSSTSSGYASLERKSENQSIKREETSVNDKSFTTALIDLDLKPRKLSQQKTVLSIASGFETEWNNGLDSAKTFRALAEKWEKRIIELPPQEASKTAPVNGNAKKPAGTTVDVSDDHYTSLITETCVMSGGSTDSLDSISTNATQSTVMSVITNQACQAISETKLTSVDDVSSTSTKAIWGTTVPEDTSSQTKVKESTHVETVRRTQTVETKTCSSSRNHTVNDLRQVFEVQDANGGMKNDLRFAPVNEFSVGSHTRMSSLDSTCSESDASLPPHYGSTTSVGSNPAIDHYGSITSLASSTSLISPQELQQLIEEANQSLEESGTPLHEIVVVVLQREIAGGSIGITLAGGADYDCKEITVNKVIGGSLADRDGRIQKGDRVLSINGRNLRNVTHKEALNILKTPRTDCVLVLSRSRDLSLGDNRIDATATFGKTLQRIPQRVSVPVKVPEHETLVTPLLEEAAEQPSTNIKSVTVHLVKDSAGLGFSLEGGKDSPLGDQPICIKKIFTGGAADKSGKLKVQDEIISINSIEVSHMARIEAWNFIRKLPEGDVSIVVNQKC